MNVTVHIERLVLDGVGVDAADVPALRRAVEAEITRLLGQGRVPPGLLAGGAVPALRTPELAAPDDASPVAWGTRIARAVHGSWGALPLPAQAPSNRPPVAERSSAR
jgi:hypothetical protein